MCIKMSLRSENMFMLDLNEKVIDYNCNWFHNTVPAFLLIRCVCSYIVPDDFFFIH